MAETAPTPARRLLGWPATTPGSAGWYYRRSWLGMSAAVVVALFTFGAVFAPWLTPYADQGRGAPNLQDRLLGPSWSHWMGTDDLGRDVLARILFGARTALLVAVGVVVLAVVVGVLIGAVAGYFGGWVDEILMRVTDTFLAFPPLLLAVIVAAALGASLRNTIIAIAVSWWPWYARQVRSQVLSIRERPFIHAVRTIGVPNRTILRRHVIPNAMSPVWVQATADLGASVLTAAGLSFVGLGPRPPTADWGVMINDGRQLVLSGQWWIAGFAGAAITLVALAFNLIGDVVRDVTDPKTRGSD
jgi:peptide/nickel transport system permease protein